MFLRRVATSLVNNVLVGGISIISYACISNTMPATVTDRDVQVMLGILVASYGRSVV